MVSDILDHPVCISKNKTKTKVPGHMIVLNYWVDLGLVGRCKIYVSFYFVGASSVPILYIKSILA